MDNVETGVSVDTSVSVEHDGSTWVGEWTNYPPYTGHDGKIAPNRYLVVYKAAYGWLVPISDLVGASRRQTMDATMLLAKKRIEEVRGQLFPVGLENMDSALDVILARIRNGDWMGQTTHNQEFTTYELAALLDVPEWKAIELAESLQTNGKITLLPGGTIIPSEQD